MTIQFDQGFAESLPYDEAAFDYVFLSMMFHHLKLDDKQMMLRGCAVFSNQAQFSRCLI